MSDANPARPNRPSRFSLATYVAGVRAGERAMLGRAITLIESRRADHRRQAQALLTALLPHTGGAQRVGITGVPGVGKSTFIESLGLQLIEQGKRVAVLAIDPSSSLSGGSILGDKTRMTELARHPRAFVRPSPSGGTLGGVAGKTREALLLCEAADFDVVLIETVGVGQSETVVAEMVDFLLLLLLPGAGDELQGIKRGIIELIDMIAINKADGGGEAPAQRAQAQYLAALKLVRQQSAHWRPPVTTVSGLRGTGIDELWRRVEEHRRVLAEHGEIEAKRRRQRRRWMWALVEEAIQRELREAPALARLLPELERQVELGETTAVLAADRLLDAWRQLRPAPLND